MTIFPFLGLVLGSFVVSFLLALGLVVLAFVTLADLIGAGDLERDLDLVLDLDFDFFTGDFDREADFRLTILGGSSGIFSSGVGVLLGDASFARPVATRLPAIFTYIPYYLRPL